MFREYAFLCIDNAPLKEQFIAMENLLQKIGCQVLMDKDYEADDFAASLVKKFESSINGIERAILIDEWSSS